MIKSPNNPKPRWPLLPDFWCAIWQPDAICQPVRRTSCRCGRTLSLKKLAGTLDGLQDTLADQTQFAKFTRQVIADLGYADQLGDDPDGEDDNADDQAEEGDEDDENADSQGAEEEQEDADASPERAQDEQQDQSQAQVSMDDMADMEQGEEAEMPEGDSADGAAGASPYL